MSNFIPNVVVSLVSARLTEDYIVLEFEIWELWNEKYGLIVWWTKFDNWHGNNMDMIMFASKIECAQTEMQCFWITSHLQMAPSRIVSKMKNMRMKSSVLIRRHLETLSPAALRSRNGFFQMGATFGVKCAKRSMVD